MAAHPDCPLDSNKFKFRESSPPIGSSHLSVIDNHISSNALVNNHA